MHGADAVGRGGGQQQPFHARRGVPVRWPARIGIGEYPCAGRCSGVRTAPLRPSVLIIPSANSASRARLTADQFQPHESLSFGCSWPSSAAASRAVRAGAVGKQARIRSARTRPSSSMVVHASRPGALLPRNAGPRSARCAPARPRAPSIRPPLRGLSHRERVQQLRGVGAQPGEDRQVLGPGEDVDRVDLDQFQPGKGPAHRAQADWCGGPAPMQPLGCDGDATGL